MGLPSTGKKRKICHYVSWFEIPALNLYRVSFIITSIQSKWKLWKPIHSMALFSQITGLVGVIVVGEGSTSAQT
jgi:hypothetical protein